jgi:hypothetical protein
MIVDDGPVTATARIWWGVAGVVDYVDGERIVSLASIDLPHVGAIVFVARWTL